MNIYIQFKLGAPDILKLGINCYWKTVLFLRGRHYIYETENIDIDHRSHRSLHQ